MEFDPGKLFFKMIRRANETDDNTVHLIFTINLKNCMIQNVLTALLRIPRLAPLVVRVDTAVELRAIMAQCKAVLP